MGSCCAGLILSSKWKKFSLGLKRLAWFPSGAIATLLPVTSRRGRILAAVVVKAVTPLAH